ncbi:hypothetical protein HCUR_00185 [Holospora curviuscula]|uniref:Uncharacterized protein n=2 Tax=Holospora curviuscula TaxID=1082868 RepID=A0A2S5RE55_9PROT|nr:hypothetical protein HCUR_00185 [Holospora curviuscula]
MAGIRIIAAAGLLLAGKDAEDIQAADEALDIALRNNCFDMPEDLDVLMAEIEFRKAAEQALITFFKNLDAKEIAEMIDMGLLMAEQADPEPFSKMGFHSARVVVKGIGYGFSRLCRAFDAFQQGGLEGLGAYLNPLSDGFLAERRVLMKTAPELQRTGARTKQQGQVPPQEAPKPSQSPNIVPEQVAVQQYFTHYRNEKFVVGRHGDGKFKKIMDARNKGNLRRTARHHVGTHHNNKIFVRSNIHEDAGVSILIPREWHQRGNVHTANKQEFENFRQALFVSIRDMRKLPDRLPPGALQQEVREDLNDALLEALRKNRETFPEQMKKKGGPS